MSESFVFKPEQRPGLVFHLIMAVAIAALGGWGFLAASRADIGPAFLLYLLPVLLAVGALPLLVYRAYSLWKASYTLEPDGLHLQWGLRAVDIPMDSVIWARPADALDQPLPLPWQRWPGSILGDRSQAGLGEVEFLASSARKLVLISTPQRAFAISPDDPQAFINAYHRVAELGSLSPFPARSVHATFLLARVWASRSARFLLLTEASLSLLLLAWVILAVPSRSQLALGFNASGGPRDWVAPVRLVLLPVLNSAIFLLDFLLGLYFFRRGQMKSDGPDSVLVLAYLVWGSGALTALLFLLAVFFILRIG
ncbi:MAG TPA: PH domain-containing protein [Anaerolineales bacterium]